MKETYHLAIIPLLRLSKKVLCVILLITLISCQQSHLPAIIPATGTDTNNRNESISTAEPIDFSAFEFSISGDSHLPLLSAKSLSGSSDSFPCSPSRQCRIKVRQVSDLGKSYLTFLAIKSKSNGHTTVYKAWYGYGSYNVLWDGLDENGKDLPDGIYEISLDKIDGSYKTASLRTSGLEEFFKAVIYGYFWENFVLAVTVYLGLNLVKLAYDDFSKSHDVYSVKINLINCEINKDYTTMPIISNVSRERRAEARLSDVLFSIYRLTVTNYNYARMKVGLSGVPEYAIITNYSDQVDVTAGSYAVFGIIGPAYDYDSPSDAVHKRNGTPNYFHPRKTYPPIQVTLPRISGQPKNSVTIWAYVYRIIEPVVVNQIKMADYADTVVRIIMYKDTMPYDANDTGSCGKVWSDNPGSGS